MITISFGGSITRKRRPHKLTDEKRKQILLALMRDRNLQRVAKQVGDISHESVRKVAKEAGVELAKRSAHTKLPEFRAKARENLQRLWTDPAFVAKQAAAARKYLKRRRAEHQLKN